MDRLESWKEIAEFFNVSVRTVQGWEVEKALPVHRNPGVRGRVWAEEAELRAWLAAQEAALPPARRRYHWLALSLVALLLAAALVASLVLRRGAGLPARVKVDGLVLICFDDRGNELWRYSLPREHNSTLAAQEVVLKAEFLDLTGDGRPEVLFPLMGDHYRNRNSLLLCFSHDGRLLWQFEPGREVRTATETHARHYVPRSLTPVRWESAQLPYLALLSFHAPNFFTQVALLDFHGRLIRQYWHAGHLTSLAVRDLDGDGVPELLLSGVSNGYGAAALVVLDPRHMAGASTEELPKFQGLELGAPVERARLLFPRTRAGRAMKKYGEAEGIIFGSNYLVVPVIDVRQGPNSPCSVSVHFRLAPTLAVLDVGIADTDQDCYRTLYANRFLSTLMDPHHEIPELRKIRVLTPWH